MREWVKELMSKGIWQCNAELVSPGVVDDPTRRELLTVSISTY